MPALLETANLLRDFKKKKTILPPETQRGPAFLSGAVPRTNVVNLQLNLKPGWNPEILSIALEPLQMECEVQEISKISIEFMIPEDCDIPGQWFALNFAFVTSENKWLQLKEKNLKGLRRGQWQRIDFEIEPGDLPEGEGRVSLVKVIINSDQAVLGSLLISRVELFEGMQIPLRADVGGASEYRFETLYAAQKDHGLGPVELTKDDLLRIYALTELCAVSQALVVGCDDDQALAGLLPPSVKDLVILGRNSKTPHAAWLQADPKEPKAQVESMVGQSFDWMSHMLEQNRQFQFIYLAGSPKTENAFIEAYYADLLLAEGGLLLMGNSSLKSISQVVKFFDTNRTRNYAKVGELFNECTIFGKVRSGDSRPWDHYIGLF
jgi:hypothetical protein